MLSKLWLDCAQKLKQDLESEGRSESLQTETFEQFQASIENLCRIYTRTNLSKLVLEKLSPLFAHVQCFEKAIAASTSQHLASSLIWSVSQAVIVSACQFSDHMESTLDQLADLYKVLPICEEYLALFNGNQRLEYALRDLYDDYAQFCILTIRYLKKTPANHLLRNVVTSRPKQQLKQILASIRTHKDDFNREAELAFRQHRIRSSFQEGRGRPGLAMMGAVHQHMISLRRNPSFVGRDSELALLWTQLNAEKDEPWAEPISCLIRGIGGMGKTQTALEYAYRYANKYDHILWLPAEQSAELRQKYGQIATNFATVDSVSSVEATDLLLAAHRWLEVTEKRWLLIFDNVERWNDIATLWPTTARQQSAIIVTSQKQEIKQWTTLDMPLKSLDVDIGAQVMLQYLKRNHVADECERKLASEIAAMFGCLPLALAHIAGYVDASGCTLAEFKDMASHRYSWIWEGDKPATLYQYDKRLDIVWDLALKDLPPAAKLLVYTMAFMNPDNIPEEMIMAPTTNVQQLHRRAGRGNAEYIEMTRQLVKRHLVSRETASQSSYYTLHRALQRGVLYKLDKDEPLRDTVFNKALSLLRAWTPSASPIQAPDPSQWPRFEVVMPQITALHVAFEQSQPPMLGSLEFAQLLYDCAFNQWEREMGHQAYGLLKTAEQVLDSLKFNKDDKLRADIHTMFGVICDNIGITMRSEGLAHKKEALRIRDLVVAAQQKAVKQVDEILQYNATNDMAEQCLQNYEYIEAEQLVGACRQKYQEWGTETEFPFEYGKYYRNTATIEALKGDSAKAIRFGKRAVELAELDAGTITPRYLLYLFDVACWTLQTGDTETALRLHKEIFEAREEICGTSHDVTLQSCYAVASVYDQMHNYREAEKWLRVALDRSAQTEWPQEAQSRTKFHLAQIMRNTKNNLAMAVDLETEAREILSHLLECDSLPDFLVGVKDELVLFDHLQPIFRGRMTGTRLLDCFRRSQAEGTMSKSEKIPSREEHEKLDQGSMVAGR